MPAMLAVLLSLEVVQLAVKVTNIHNRVSRQETNPSTTRKVHHRGLTPFYVVYGTPHRLVTMTTSVLTTTNADRIRLLRDDESYNLRRTGNVTRARYVTLRSDEDDVLSRSALDVN